MQLQTVSTQKPKAKLAIQGPSGAGKSFTALLLAFGLTGSYEKIALIDTDGASCLYSYFGPFNTLSIATPFSSNKFVEALELCERSGIEAIIIDTLSSEWMDDGGVVEGLRQAEGDALLRDTILDSHSDLISAIGCCSVHLIATIRRQEGYHLSIAGSRKEVEKIGLAPIQQDSIHYHFHTVLSLDMKHRVRPLKDRTSFFEEQGPVLVTEEIAALYAKWCGESQRGSLPETLEQRVRACTSTKELLELLLQTDPEEAVVRRAFAKRKLELQQIEENPISLRQNLSPNGTDHLRATA